MSDLELAKVTAIMQDCNTRHEETRKRQDEVHLTKVKRAISVRIWLPVGLLCTLLIALMTMLYNIGVESAKIVKTVELQSQTIEAQTQAMGAEVNLRVLTDQQLSNDIKANNTEIKANFQWLLEHGQLKTRGTLMMPNIK